MMSFLKRFVTSNDEVCVPHEEMCAVVDQQQQMVIDVREPHEYAAGHVKGAVNMPLSSFNPALIDPTRPVVLICQAGGRSAKALGLLHAAHHPQARHYKPGTGGWIARCGSIAN